MQDSDAGNITCQAFSIALERPEHGNYTAGETVRGKLMLMSKVDEPVAAVNVQLQGLKTLRLGRGELLRTVETPIIEHTRVLYESESDNCFPAYVTHTWPFDITFPEFYRPDAELAEYDMPEPLPPSLPYRDAPHSSQTHVCSVDYCLVATLTRPPGAWPIKGYECKAPLLYVMPPSRIPSFVDAHKRLSTNSFDVETLIAENGSERRSSAASNLSLTKKNWYKLIKADEYLVPYSYELCTTTYDHVCIGQTMPVGISVRPLPGAPDTSIRPRVSLKAIWPTVRGITSVQLGEDLRTEGIKCITRYTYSKTPGQGFNEFEYESNYAKEFSLDIRWDPAIVPTFGVANMSRVYLFKIVVVARCAGKELRMETQHSLTILPEPPSVGRPVAAALVDEHDAPPLYTTNQIPTDPLPSYQENAAAVPAPAVLLPPAIDYPPPLNTPPAEAYRQGMEWGGGITAGGAGDSIVGRS